MIHGDAVDPVPKPFVARTPYTPVALIAATIWLAVAFHGSAAVKTSPAAEASWIRNVPEVAVVHSCSDPAGIVSTMSEPPVSDAVSPAAIVNGSFKVSDSSRLLGSTPSIS